MNTPTAEEVRAKITAQELYPTCVDKIDNTTFYVGLPSTMKNRIALNKAGFRCQLGRQDDQHIIIELK